MLRCATFMHNCVHKHMECYAVLGPCTIVAGTQQLDSTWRHLKKWRPQSSQQKSEDKFGCKWHVVQIRKLLHAETQCQECQQFDFEKPEQHSVALMLKKNLLKRLLIPVLENTQILMRFFQPIDDKISISL